jgi:hypothetical protein
MAQEDKKPKLPSAYHTAPALRPRRRSRRRRTMLTTLVILILAGATGFFAYKWHQANQQAKLEANPKAAAAQQIDDLVDQVSKLVVLPTGETPTVATVTDISKLKGQAFFAPAQNGDKVLIYTQAKKAVLYRPSENRVIEIAPLNIGNNSSSSGSSDDSSQAGDVNQSQ